MSALWTTAAMVEAMGGRPFGTLPESVSGISIDTRTLKPGEAFFAIKGEQFDGHDFATAAMVAGASVLVVAEAKLPAFGRLKVPMIVVEDVLAALARLGIAARERSKAKVIAVTGSAGKTTTKEALRHVLAGCGKVHASAKSFNNHWGVPLTLARLPEDADFAVFEIGMNHPDEIRPLVKLVRPHVAVITLIAAAHLGHFKNLEEIAAAKAEIFEGLVPEGVALLNRDDAQWKLLLKLAKAAKVRKVLGFGQSAGADYKLLDCQLRPDGSLITFKAAGHELTAEVGAPGRHMVQNALAVIGAAHLAGAEMSVVAERLSGMTPEQGRGQRHLLEAKGVSLTLIDESYNANPASMKAAIELLAATPVGEGGRRIAVLGDMLELGEHSERLHAGLAEHLAGKGIDMVFLGGAEMQALKGVLPEGIAVEHRATAAELKDPLLSTVGAGDVVMVKSSKSVGFSKLVEAIVDAFQPKSRAKTA